MLSQVFWEILKVKIRGISISHSMKKAREERKIAKKLEEDIQILEDVLCQNPNKINDLLLNDKKQELEKHREKTVEGLLLRSRANFHENGEKCSKYFCSLEKKNYVNKTITELIDENGKHISNQNDILNAQENFYRKLYGSKLGTCELKTVCFFNMMSNCPMNLEIHVKGS